MILPSPAVAEWLLGTLLGAVPLQDPPATGDAPEAPRVLSAVEARDLLTSLGDKLADKEPRLRKEAAEALGSGQNEQFVAPLVKLLKDREPGVAMAAAAALGHQPFKSSQDALLKLLQNEKLSAKEGLRPAVIDALGQVGWSKKGYTVLRESFDRAPKEEKLALIRAFVQQKEKQAFSLLVDLIDEPKPENPNSPSNPPASYWQAKWTEWNHYKSDVRRGLTTLTGESFATRKIAVEWAETEAARKAGFVYKKGD